MFLESKNLNLDKLSDIISLMPLIYNFGLLFMYLGNRNKKNLKFIFLYFLITIIGDLIKILPYSKIFYNITRRPRGARNCDILSKEGLKPENSPGFPSGHMLSVTFFAIYFMSNYNLSILQRNCLYLTVILTAWARIYKKCHNLFQVIFGIIIAFVYNLYFPKLINLN